MMYGNNWFRNSSCSFLGSNMFSIWHFLIMFGLVIIVVALLLWFRGKNKNGNQGLNSLKELYVKGEITEEEYLKRKNVIER